MSDPIPNDAARVIEAFGGIRPMAKKLGVAVTTIQGWKERNAIPIRRLDEIRTAAAREGIDLGALAVATESPVENRGAAPPAGDVPFSERSAGAGPARAETVEAEPLRAERPVQTPSGVKEAESAAAGPTVDAVPAKPDGRRRAFAFGLGFAAMLIAGALIGWAVADRTGGQAGNAELVAALEKRLVAAEKTAADAAAAAAVARSAAAAAGREAGKLAGRLKAAEAAQAALAGKVAATDNSAAVEVLGAAVKAVRADVERLRQAVAASRGRRESREARRRSGRPAGDGCGAAEGGGRGCGTAGRARGRG